MSKLAHSHPDGLLVECGQCETLVHENQLSEAASEMVRENVCLGCAQEVFEANGQFGVGA